MLPPSSRQVREHRARWPTVQDAGRRRARPPRDDHSLRAGSTARGLRAIHVGRPRDRSGPCIATAQRDPRLTTTAIRDPRASRAPAAGRVATTRPRRTRVSCRVEIGPTRQPEAVIDRRARASGVPRSRGTTQAVSTGAAATENSSEALLLVGSASVSPWSAREPRTTYVPGTVLRTVRLTFEVMSPPRCRPRHVTVWPAGSQGIAAGCPGVELTNARFVGSVMVSTKSKDGPGAG